MPFGKLFCIFTVSTKRKYTLEKGPSTQNTGEQDQFQKVRHTSYGVGRPSRIILTENNQFSLISHICGHMCCVWLVIRIMLSFFASKKFCGMNDLFFSG